MISEADLAPLREAAEQGRTPFQQAFLKLLAERPDLGGLVPVILYETLGRSLGEGNQAAALLWGAAHTLAGEEPDAVRRAGFEEEGPALGEALFDAIFTRPEGVVITSDPYEVSFERIHTDDGKIQLDIPELIGEFEQLVDEKPPARDDAYPFVLAAGERRTNTANTIYRDPDWRRKDREGTLRMSPGDATRLGVDTGDRVRVTTKRGSVDVPLEVTDTLRDGHVTLPNGMGLEYPDERGERIVTGAPPNELTASEDRDWIAGTPWHKHVRARVEALG